MKTYRVIAAFAALLFVAGISVPPIANAAELRASEQVTINSSETIRDNLYLAAGSVTNSGTVQGDLVAAGGSILIGGSVTSDVFVAGGSLTILGPVGGDVRVAGGNIVITGDVKGDVVGAGGQMQISGGKVGGDIMWGGGVINISAPVGGDLKLAGGEVTVDSAVQGNVEFRGKNLVLGKNAVINGNLTYSTPSEVVMDTGAVVKGKVSYTPMEETRPTKVDIATIFSLALLVKALALLACAFAIGLIFKRFIVTLTTNAMAAPLLEFGRGVAVIILLPILSVALLLTVLGMPLGFMGLASFGMLSLLAGITAPILLGSVIMKWITKKESYEVSWKTIPLGVGAYLLIGLVPFIGWLAAALVFLITAGVLSKLVWNGLKAWR